MTGKVEHVGVGRDEEGDVECVYVDCGDGGGGCFRFVFKPGADIVFEQTESMTVLKF